MTEEKRKLQQEQQHINRQRMEMERQQQQLNAQRAEIKRQQRQTIKNQSLANADIKSKKKSVTSSSIFIFVIVSISLFFFISIVGIKVYERLKPISIGCSSNALIGKDFTEVKTHFDDAGFTNITFIPNPDLGIEQKSLENTVYEISINGVNSFDSNSNFSRYDLIKIYYHLIKEIKVPISSEKAEKMDYKELVAQLEKAGFVNITSVPHNDLITGWITKENSVESITIDGDDDFTANNTYRPDVNILITYHSFE